MLQNSMEPKLTANLPRGVLEPLKCSPRNYGAFKVRPAEFWSNAMCALLSHGDIVTGAKIPTKIINNLDLPYFVKVIFVNHCHFRDLYNQYDNCLRKNISQDGTFKLSRSTSSIVREASWVRYFFLNKPAAQAAGADPSQCSSISKPN